jgi:hypothetical protein
MERPVRVPFEGKTVEGVDLDFKALKEEWNEYQVNDGSIIRMKVVVTNIAKIIDRYDTDGNPIYVVKSSNVLTVSAPEKIRKGTVVS